MKSDRTNSYTVWGLIAAVLLTLAVTIIGYTRDKSLTSKLEQVVLQLNQAKTENGEIKAELESIRSEFGNIKGTTEAVEALLSSSSKDFATALRSGLRRNEQLIKEKEDTLDQIKEELKNFQDKIAGLDEKNQGVIDSLRVDVNNFTNLLNQKNEELERLSRAVENLMTLQASLKSDLEQAVSQVKPNREMKKLQEDHHIKIVELQEDLRKKSDSFNREMTRMEGDIKELRLEVNRLSAIKSRD